MDRPPLDVLFVSPFGERLGGSEAMLWSLLRSVDRQRVLPRVVFLRPGPFEREVAARGLTTRVVATGRFREPLRAARAVRTLGAIARRSRPDLVVSWLHRAHVYAGTGAWLAGSGNRSVWWQHRLPGDVGWLDRVATAVPAAAIGASSRAGAAEQAKLWPHRPTFAVHPGIELPVAASQDRLAALRSTLRLPPDRPVVGIVGRLERWKGQEVVLDALAALRAGGHDVRGLVVGGATHGVAPDYERRLHERAESLGLAEAVVFTGHVDNVAEHLELMDVAVNASALEPFGIALLEAMALGVPVVAVDAAGPAEIVEDGRSGRLIERPDPLLLSGALGHLLERPGLRTALAEGGRRRVLERFTSEAMALRLADHLEALAGRT